MTSASNTQLSDAIFSFSCLSHDDCDSEVLTTSTFRTFDVLTADKRIDSLTLSVNLGQMHLLITKYEFNTMDASWARWKWYCNRRCLSIFFICLCVGNVTAESIYPLFNPLDSKGNYCATSNNTKLVHWPLMNGLLHLVQRGGAWAGCGPAQSLLAVPNVTAHQSTASVPITVWRSIALWF